MSARVKSFSGRVQCYWNWQSIVAGCQLFKLEHSGGFRTKVVVEVATLLLLVLDFARDRAVRDGQHLQRGELLLPLMVRIDCFGEVVVDERQVEIDQHNGLIENRLLLALDDDFPL